jgi:DNA-binding NarL/FixJ family response regulator
MSLKVVIVDDHEVAREGLADLLKAVGFNVAKSCADGGSAVAFLESTQVDVVLVDVRIPGCDGLAILEKLRELKPTIPVVFVSSYDNPTYIARAAALGAQDYLLKSGLRKNLQRCLTIAVEGTEPPEESRLVQIRQMMDEQVDVATLPPELPLTSREAQVLKHVALGLSNKEIARSLKISVETVKEHVQNVLRKINATDRTDAAVRAVKLGIVN